MSLQPHPAGPVSLPVFGTRLVLSQTTSVSYVLSSVCLFLASYRPLGITRLPSEFLSHLSPFPPLPIFFLLGECRHVLEWLMPACEPVVTVSRICAGRLLSVSVA